MSDSHDTDAAVTALASPGEALQRERETQGLSRHDVATALNLRPAVVAGLEEDRYDEVPIAAYRRGYLRAYARLLGLDEQPILDSYLRHFSHAEPAQHTAPVQVTRPPSRLGAWLFKLASLLVIAGLVGLTLLWWQSRGGSEPPDLGDSSPVAVDRLDGTPSEIDSDPIPPVAAPPPVPPAEPVTEPAAETTPEADAEVDTSARPAPDATEPPAATVADDAANDAASTAETTPVADASPTVEAAPATEEERAAEETAVVDPRLLVFTFNEQSWTEVFDARNQRIFVGLQEPGTTARVEGEPPFRLTVGNATGVELVWRDAPVDLGQRAGANNVARFTLGE